MKEALANFPWPWLPITALFIFLGFFLLLLVHVNQPGTKETYRNASEIPFDDGEHHE